MGLFRDFRYALRTLWQSPGFALTAIVILALSIGANTAIFSVVYAVILRPLPYPDASRLVFVWQRFPGIPAPFTDHMMVAPQNYLEWRRQNTVFQEMAAFRTTPVEETGSGSAETVFTTFASASLLHMLGTEPGFGRLFRPDEERAGREHVAVLNHAYFDRRFHGDQKALGKSVTLDDTSYTVIGVLPAGFYLPRTLVTDRQPDVLVPLPDVTQDSKDHRPLLVAARLRPDVSLAQARTEMAGVAARLQRQEKPDADLYTLGSASIFPFSVENTEPSLNRALYLLLAAVALVLLIACANLANLTLARATLRSREIMVRLALGATRSRVLALLLSESLLVALVAPRAECSWPNGQSGSSGRSSRQIS